MVLDQWLRGRRRALWLSQSDKLLEDARRDWAALGGREADVIALAKVRSGEDVPHDEGILFATYATLRSPARQGRRSRLAQVVAWLAGGLDEASRHAFAGVVVFDEAHAMANAAGGMGSRGRTAPSQQGRAGLKLQSALPDARVLYVSATGATTRTSGWARTRRERHGYPVRENGAYSGTTGSVGDAMAGAAHRSDKPDEVAELTTRSLRARGGGKG